MNWKILTTTLVLLLAVSAANAQNIQILEKICQDNYVVAKIVDSSGVIGYRILEFCPYGCMYGSCLTKREIPSIKIEKLYEVKACQDNVIFFEIKNEGTRGDLSIDVDSEISDWIRVPTKVSLFPNETKTIALIVSVPCNVSGVYPLTIIGKGTISFYAPTTIKVSDTKISYKIPITTTITPINIKIAAIFVLIAITLFVGYKIEIGKKLREEKF